MPDSRRGQGNKLYDDRFAEHARKALAALVEREGSQRAAARKLGVAQATVSRLLNATSGEQLQLATLIELRRELRISLDEMLGLPPLRAEEPAEREEFASRLRALLTLLESNVLQDEVQRARDKGGKGR